MIKASINPLLLADPKFVDLVEKLMPMAEWNARVQFDMPGAYFPHSAYPVPSNVNPYPVPPWGYEVCETPWTVQSLWWHYQYTLDDDFLMSSLFTTGETELAMLGLAATSADEPLLQVQDLAKHYEVTRGMMRRKTGEVVRAVDGVSFSISRGESFGLVGLEALACGRPVVSTPVGAMESLIKQSQAGRVVSDTLPRSLADGIQSIITSSTPEADEIRKSVLEYSWSNVASAVITEYERAIEEQSFEDDRPELIRPAFESIASCKQVA